MGGWGKEEDQGKEEGIVRRVMGIFLATKAKANC